MMTVKRLSFFCCRQGGHLQNNGGQKPKRQLSLHHESYFSFPENNPTALQLANESAAEVSVSVTGESVWAAGGSVSVTGESVWAAGVSVSVTGGSVSVTGGAVRAGGCSPLGVILMSAQLTNVSCAPSPKPHSPETSSQPLLFPAVHVHCITQWSHDKSRGSTRSMAKFPVPFGWGHLASPLVRFSRCVSLSWVMGGSPIFPTRNSE